jgi:hypothetical protein
MTTFTVKLHDGQSFQMEADLSQASASISANFHGDDDTWQVTPYQTADARHNKFEAARLVAEYFSAGEDDCTAVSKVEVA